MRTLSIIQIFSLMTLLFFSGCSSIAPSPPTVPTASGIDGQFDAARFMGHEALRHGIEAPLCEDETATHIVFTGEGEVEWIGDVTVLLSTCLEMFTTSLQGAGIIATSEGELLNLELTSGSYQDAGLRVHFEIVGGTGRFAGASGTGQIHEVDHATTVFSNSEFHFELDGEIVTQRVLPR